MISRDNIYYELSISPFKFSSGDLCFYFSSALNLEKFIKRMDDEKNRINESLSNRFKCNIVFDDLPLLTLYRNVERRGYLISFKGDNLTWQDNITFLGMIASEQNLQDLEKTTTPK